MSTATLNRQQLATEVIDRIANSPAYKQILADERKDASDRRNAQIRAAKSEIMARTETQDAAQARADALRPKVEEAHSKWSKISTEWAEHHNAAYLERASISHLTGIAENKAREAADPRIWALRSHVEHLRRQTMQAFAFTGATLHYTVRSSEPSTILSNNVAQIEAAKAKLNSLLAELDHLLVSEYGDDLRDRLQAILDRAEQAVAPLAQWTKRRHDPANPEHVIED